MHPILFSIGPIRIYSYGFMLAVGFLAAVYLALKRVHLFNIPEEPMGNLAFVLLISGIIGARILYILLNISYFIKHPFEAFLIHRGGLVFYGGVLLALLAGVIFAKINKLSVLDAGDLMAPFIVIGHAIGRIGCFLNGCCYGKPTSSHLGVIFPGRDIKVYPTQLFSSAGLFIIFLILFYLQRRRRFKGEILLLYFIFYGILRFFIDFLRGDLMPIAYNLTVTQIISICCIFIGLCLYFRVRYEKRDYHQPGQRPR